MRRPYRPSSNIQNGDGSGGGSSCGFCILWVWVWLCTTVLRVSAQQNVTLQNDSSELVYLPAFCGLEVLETVPRDCEGIWTPVFLDGSSGGSVTTTSGPSQRFGNILPQVFFVFRGSAVFVKTSALSNATANLTVSSQPSGFYQNRVFEPSVDFWAIFDLSPDDTTTVALTYLPDFSGNVTRLDIDFIKISVPDASQTTSFLPTQTIPPSIYMPFSEIITLTPTSTSDTSGRSGDSSARGTIIGATVAAVFAFIGLLIAAFIYWRRLRRRRFAEERRMQAQAARQVMVQQSGSGLVIASVGDGRRGVDLVGRSEMSRMQLPSPAISRRGSSLALPIWSRWRSRHL